MNATFAFLVGSGARLIRKSGVWWTVGIVSMVVINLAFWPSLENSGALSSFEDMGDALKAFGAQNIATPSGYVDGQVFALVVPLLLSGMAIMSVTAITSGDEVAGRLELLHALPIDRRLLWAGRWTAATVLVLGASVITALSTLVCLPLFSLEEVSAGRVITATAGCFVLAVFHGSVGYLAGALGLTRAGAVGASLGVLLAGYLASFVLPLSASLENARDFSPWYWALGDQPVTNGISIGPLLIVLAIALVLAVAGTVTITRRDIRTA